MSYLLNSIIEELQNVGLQLKERLIKEFPTDDFSTVLGKEQLGDYFFRKGNFKKAERHYKQVIDYYCR